MSSRCIVNFTLRFQRQDEIVVKHACCGKIVCKNLNGSPLDRGRNLQISLRKTRNVNNLPAWIGDIAYCCEGPSDPLRGVAGLESKTINNISEKLL